MDSTHPYSAEIKDMLQVDEAPIDKKRMTEALTAIIQDPLFLNSITRIGLSRHAVYEFRKKGIRNSLLIVKTFEDQQEAERHAKLMEFDHQAMDDKSMVPRVLAIVPIDQYACVIMERIPGITLSQISRQFGIPEEYRTEVVDTTLRYLHQRTAKIALLESMGIRPVHETREQTIRKGIERIQRATSEDISGLDDMLRESITSDTEPDLLIHGDLTPTNIIIGASKYGQHRLVIIDPERTGLGSAFADLTNLEVTSGTSLQEQISRYFPENHLQYLEERAVKAVQAAGRAIKHGYVDGKISRWAKMQCEQYLLTMPETLTEIGRHRPSANHRLVAAEVMRITGSLRYA